MKLINNEKVAACILWVLIVAGALLCAGCANVVRTYPETEQHYAFGAVTWPEGMSTDPADYVTTKTLDGRMRTTAPIKTTE